MRYEDVHSESCSVAVQIYPLVEVALPEPHRLRIDRHLTAHIYIPANRCRREKMCVALTILLESGCVASTCYSSQFATGWPKWPSPNVGAASKLRVGHSRSRTTKLTL